MPQMLLSIDEINKILEELTPTLKSDASISVSTAVYENASRYLDPAWVAAHPKVFDKSNVIVDDAFRAKVAKAISEKYKDPEYAAKMAAAKENNRIPKAIYDEIYQRCFGADRGGKLYAELSIEYNLNHYSISSIAQGSHVWCDREQFKKDRAEWERKYQQKGGVTFDVYKQIYSKCFGIDRLHPVAMYRKLAAEFNVSEGAIGKIGRGTSPWTDKVQFVKDVAAWNQKFNK